MGYVPKWVKLDQPTCALNAKKPKRYSVQYSPVIPDYMDAETILDGYVPIGSKHLIINAHGSARPTPVIELGKGIRPSDVASFERFAMRPDLNVIWFSACNIAVSEEGIDFCKAIAVASRCYVVAHIMEIPDVFQKLNCIEDYERSIPIYIDRFGTAISRSRFFSDDVAGSYGFKLM